MTAEEKPREPSYLSEGWVNFKIREELGFDNDNQYKNEQDRAEIQNLNEMDAQMVLYDREEIANKLKVKYDALRRDYLAKEEKAASNDPRKPPQPVKPRQMKIAMDDQDDQADDRDSSSNHRDDSDDDDYENDRPKSKRENKREQKSSRKEISTFIRKRGQGKATSHYNVDSSSEGSDRSRSYDSEAQECRERRDRKRHERKQSEEGDED